MLSLVLYLAICILIYIFLHLCFFFIFFFFFFNDTATTEIYTLSLHDALPICRTIVSLSGASSRIAACCSRNALVSGRSEEHTSELQSQSNLVCRLLLEKKKKKEQVIKI